MMDKIIRILKDGNISIPRTLLLNYKKLNISEKDLIILIYLLNEKETIFNPKKISDEFGLSLEDVMMSIDNLSNADLIKIVLKKVNNIREEYISLDNLYNRLSYLCINEEEKKEEKNNIFDVFEREFGRTLSSMEYEIINTWLNDKVSEEVIIEALKEATYNGVSNLRYVDKILYEWRKKGINNKEQVEQNRKMFNEKKEQKKELFDYDWLNDE